MCGIFGLVRNENADHPERATAVLAELGKRSVSRGRDSAGVAFIPMITSSSSVPATRTQANSKVTTLGGGVVVVKDTDTFDNVWRDKRDIPFASSSTLMIGHTRAATQGSKSDRTNASPLAVGTLIGTHNGDIDDTTVSNWLSQEDKTSFGGTDTETLYRAINSVKSHRGKVREILETAQGRIALAWYDRRLPGRMFLARGGLSPLSISYDREGNLYWASNPQWFRDIDAQFKGAIGFHSTFLVPEGRLITVRFSTGEPVVDDMREFIPTVRYSDTYLPDTIVWRDFDKADLAADQKAKTHLVTERPAPVYSYKSGKGAGYASKYSAGFQTASDYASASQRRWDGEWEDYKGSGFRGDDEVISDAWLSEDGATNDDGTPWWNGPGAGDDEFEYCSEAEGLAALEAAAELLEMEQKGTGGGAASRIALIEAKKASSFASVAKGYGLPSEESARAFVSLVLSSN